MKIIPTTEAEGHVICHDITRIVRGVTKETAFRKGHIVQKADIPVLLSLGKENLYVWEKRADRLHENEAAEILYALCAGEFMSPTPVREGKIEVVAEADGLLRVEVEKLRQINSLGEIMIAARRTNSPVTRGAILAGTRVIPLVIAEKKIKAARELAGTAPLLKLHPFKPKTFGIVTTGSEVLKGIIQDTFTPAIRAKLAAYDSREIGQTFSGDDPAAVTEAILNFIGRGAELVLCTGGMSVDPDDQTPLGIKKTGGRIVTYGAPVLPGSMFLLSYWDNRVPVLGLPGCVMYEGRTVFDLVLPRIMADVPVSGADLAALGHGGLCLKCPACIFPNCGFGSGI
jgi:hypothetical protein